MALQARKVSGAFEKRAPGQAPGGAPWVNFCGSLRAPILLHSLLCGQL